MPEGEKKIKVINTSIDIEVTPGVPVPGGTSSEKIDTSDATATESDIRKGKTAYVKGVKVLGNLDVLDTSDATATAEDIVSGKFAYGDNRKINGTLDTSYTEAMLLLNDILGKENE